jgi:hypothetical protein
MRTSKSKKADVESGWSSSHAPPTLDRISLSVEDYRKSLFLRFCNALHLLTTLAMLFSMCVHGYFMVFPCNKFIALRLGHFLTPYILLNDLPEGVVRFFSLVCSVLVMFCEHENSFIAKQFSFLDSWVFRGLFIVVIGSLQLLIPIPCQLMMHYQVNLVAGMAAVGLGLVYTVLGLLCFRQLRNRQIEAIRRRKQTELQAQSLAEQKGEIELLLAETQKKLMS